jgi:hypothetical protein
MTRFRLTSGGIATDHMATPAVPPANMTAPMDNGGAAAFSPVPGTMGAAGDNFFLSSSYVAKYLCVSAALFVPTPI